MKTKLFAVFAGVALAMAVYCRAQQNQPVYQPAPAPVSGYAVSAPGMQAPAASQLVCGHCGELLQAPAVVYVARPVNPNATTVPQPGVPVNQMGYALNQPLPAAMPPGNPYAAYYGAPPPPVQYQVPVQYVRPAMPYPGYYDGYRIPVPPRNVLLFQDCAPPAPRYYHPQIAPW